MPNTQQNNIQTEFEQTNKETNLLQDGFLKKRKKSESMSKWVNAHQKNTNKKGQRTNLSQTKEIQNIVKDIFQNKIKQVEKNTNLLQNILTQVKENKEIISKRPEENSKNA